MCFVLEQLGVGNNYFSLEKKMRADTVGYTVFNFAVTLEIQELCYPFSSRRGNVCFFPEGSKA